MEYPGDLEHMMEASELIESRVRGWMRRHRRLRNCQRGNEMNCAQKAIEESVGAEVFDPTRSISERPALQTDG
jgi:hypothetical protein